MTLTELDESRRTDADPDGTEAREPAGGGSRRSRLRLAMGVLLAVGVAATLVLGVQARSAAMAEAEERAVLVTARQTVTDLITVDATTAPEVYERLRAGATGRWGEQLGGQEASFVGAIQGAAVTSRGRITEAAVERHDAGIATALVAATAAVTNDQTATPEARQYRIALELVRADDDRWLVAGLEFVP